MLGLIGEQLGQTLERALHRLGFELLCLDEGKMAEIIVQGRSLEALVVADKYLLCPTFAVRGVIGAKT